MDWLTLPKKTDEKISKIDDRRFPIMPGLKAAVKSILDLYPRWLIKREYDRQSFTRFNERAVEYGFVFQQLARYYPKKVLDVGTGTTALPHLISNCGCVVTAIDNIKDYWPYGMTNRHYHVLDDDITHPKMNEKFDLITCVSVLEHIEKAETAVSSMFRLLIPGGRLLITFPYTELKYVRNVYDLQGSLYGQDAPYICQSFSRKEITSWISAGQAEIVEQEYWKFWSGDYWTLGQQIIPPEKVSVRQAHQLTCLLFKRL